MGFSGVSTVLGHFVLATEVPQGAFIGSGREGHQFIERLASLAKGTSSIVIEKQSRDALAVQIPEGDKMRRSAWNSINISNLALSNVRGIGSNVSMIIADSLDMSGLQALLDWLSGAGLPVVYGRDVHLVLVFKAFQEEPDNFIDLEMFKGHDCDVYTIAKKNE
jgi:hypothetical protein